MTSRGLKCADFEKIAEFLHEALTIAVEVQNEHGKMLKDWKKGLVDNPKMEALKKSVEAFAESFPMPGFTRESIDI